MIGKCGTKSSREQLSICVFSITLKNASVEAKSLSCCHPVKYYIWHTRYDIGKREKLFRPFHARVAPEDEAGWRMNLRGR